MNSAQKTRIKEGSLLEITALLLISLGTITTLLVLLRHLEPRAQLELLEQPQLIILDRLRRLTKETPRASMARRKALNLIDSTLALRHLLLPKTEQPVPVLAIKDSDSLR